MADLYTESVPFEGQPVRFLAQRIHDGKWLSWDLPLNEAKIKNTLSGPAVITGKIEPEDVEVSDLGLQPWGTWIHAEIEGQIRASGILQPGSLEDETLEITAEGVSGYPHGMLYVGTVYTQYDVEVGDIVRHIWDHLQSFSNGDLGVTVEGVTGVKRGTPKKESDPESGPYQLASYNGVDCGEEIKKLAESTPFDFREIDAWNAGRTAVTHKILIGKLGAKLDHLHFAGGVNIVDQPRLPALQEYANVVVGFGAGEGSKRVMATSSVVVPGQLRRMLSIDDQSVTKKDRMKSLTDIKLRQVISDIRFDQIAVDAHSDDAVYGSYSCGDYILVEYTMPYLGDVALWHQITGIEYEADTELVTLDLNRADPL